MRMRESDLYPLDSSSGHCTISLLLLMHQRSHESPCGMSHDLQRVAGSCCGGEYVSGDLSEFELIRGNSPT
jgi:hypothetical protein